jgi:hypothetical protein
MNAMGFPKTYLPAILSILLRDERLAEDVTVETLAARTDSFSGSDLKRKIFYSRKRIFVVLNLLYTFKISVYPLHWIQSRNTSSSLGNTSP